MSQAGSLPLAEAAATSVTGCMIGLIWSKRLWGTSMPEGAKPPQQLFVSASPDDLLLRLLAVRSQTRALAAPLSDGDATAQSMPDASPAKWHLAHTTWFFEAFVLEPSVAGYQCFDPKFAYLFNSYYESMGERYERPNRGLLTRPSLADILAYRSHVDAALAKLSGDQIADLYDLLELGLHHEQQHQELLLTDLLHLFAQNPLEPAYAETPEKPADTDVAVESIWCPVPTEAGTVVIGAPEDGFAFDCERPRHAKLIAPCEIASRPVTNKDYLAFIEADGYSDPHYWLSDGWATVSRDRWDAPLYWRRERDGGWSQMTLFGRQPVDLNAPVCHISYYEADAYARFRGCRLPREEEWEAFAQSYRGSGHKNLLGPAFEGVQPVPRSDTPAGLFGGVWEWTSSAYLAYPGFKPLEGAPGEYNGKFMSGQFVLKGGSCATPEDHIRGSYRNFFYPHQRWQFMGLRLARDCF